MPNNSSKRARTNQNNEEEIQQEEAKEDQMIQPEQLPVPQSPTQAEWIEHQVTHIPYKAWCPICVKNAAMNNPHKPVCIIQEVLPCFVWITCL